MTTFRFRVNEGEERELSVKTGVYVHAVAAIPALFDDITLPFDVEIWCPELVPQYGPYLYIVTYDECMNFIILNAVKQHSTPTAEHEG